MTKVLMFGWEFPPHISGGLGTACFGLTSSLIAANVQVLFVVPRLYGEESAHETYLINASAVKPVRKTVKRTTSSTRSVISHQREMHSEPVRHFEQISVPARIIPYTSPDETKIGSKQNITSWNYRLSTRYTTTSHRVTNVSQREITFEDDAFDQSYTFSGTYGPNLMEEVQRYAEVARTLARQHSFDVIHAHDWMTFLAGIEAKKISKKPLVLHVHSTEFDRAGSLVNKAVLQIEQLGLNQADKIIAVSNWTKAILKSRYQIPEQKITVVHNGILPKDQPPPFAFPELGSHFVTFLGRVTHQKGPRYFVEAANKVLQEFPEAHFIVAGAGDLLPQIIEQVAQLNMSSNFHFTGFLTHEQVDRIWSLTDVYVMPSVSEPFGIAPLEAIQGGVPVILSKQSGVSEVMPHAIKVDFWDTPALASAICSVLRYESLSNVLRQNSSKHIQNLTWEKAASDIKGVYNEVTRK